MISSRYKRSCFLIEAAIYMFCAIQCGGVPRACAIRVVPPPSIWIPGSRDALSRKGRTQAMTIDVAKALAELRSKTDAEIQQDTSCKWAAFAIAAYQLYSETSLSVWLIAARDYEGEALEHAALARDDGKTLRAIEATLQKATMR